MDFLSTFRGRLLLILAVLLVTILSVQYYLNLQRQRENLELLELRERAFLSGIAVGFNSITSDDRLQEFVKKEGLPFYDNTTTQRIKDILIINSSWEVNDSLSDEYLPTTGEDGETLMLDLRQIKTLPRLQEGADMLGKDINNFPNRAGSNTIIDEGEAHAIPIETDQGRWYVMVVLKGGRQLFALFEPLNRWYIRWRSFSSRSS